MVLGEFDQAEKVASNKFFGGTITKYKFKSPALGGTWAKFNVFIPKEPSSSNEKFPLLYYLAGLECSEDTGAWKGGFLRDAAEHDLALLFPDTSPRGADIEGEDDDWDFGSGAGFYLDATKPKYSAHYSMYSHVVNELPRVILTLNLPIDLSRQSVFGHSMGGHGALILYLRSFPKFRSVSAFSPVANPSQSPWGKKAFEGYLNNGVEEGKIQWDATELLKRKDLKGNDVKVLIDVGDEDKFYKQKQLLPENFIESARAAGFDVEKKITLNVRQGYDHSYYFVSTFAPEHIKYHAAHLKA